MRAYKRDFVTSWCKQQHKVTKHYQCSIADQFLLYEFSYKFQSPQVELLKSCWLVATVCKYFQQMDTWIDQKFGTGDNKTGQDLKCVFLVRREEPVIVQCTIF